MAARASFHHVSPIIAVLSATLVTATAILGQSANPRNYQVGGDTSRTDAEGLPLPEGALARIGSARFRHDGETARMLAFSPDSRLIASVSIRGVHVFECADGRLLHQVLVPSNQVVHVIRFIGDGQQLAIAAGGGAGSKEPLDVLLYDFGQGKVISRSHIPGEHWCCLGFTEDGTGVLIHGRNWKIYLWDLVTGRKKWTIDLPDPGSATPADGQHFVMVRGNGTEVRDVGTGKVVATMPTPDSKPDEGPFGDGIPKATRGSNGKTAFCLSRERNVIVRDDSGEVSVYDIPPPGRDSIWTVFGDRYSVCFSSDARYVVCTGNAPRDVDGTYVWDLNKSENRRPVVRLPGSGCAAFSPDGKWLALDISGVITLWRTTDWKPLFEPIDSAFTLRDVFFSPDGNTVFGRSEFGWSAWPARGGAGRVLIAEKKEYFSWQLSANGLVTAGVLTSGGDLLVDHLATGRKVQIPVNEFEQCPWFEISPDGQSVKVEDRKRGMGIVQFVNYDTQTGRVRSRQRPAPDTYFIRGDIAPSGTGLIRSISRNLSGDLIVKDYQTGGQSMLPFTEGLNQARFSRGGKWLALETNSQAREDAVEIWDAVLGRRLGVLGGGSQFNNRIAFSSDGRTILSGNYYGALRVFEVATCAERMRFQHDREIRSVALDERATRALASSDDAPAYVWDLIGHPGQWDSAKANDVWEDLASGDAQTAYRSIRILRVHSREAIALLKHRMTIATVPSPETVGKLIKELDASAFRDRENAQKELLSIADVVRPQLIAAQKNASDEAGSRLTQLVQSTENLTPARLRQVRACEVLEAIRTSEAIELLRSWAAGPNGSRLAVEAKQTLARIKR